jgi:hypothetical protein
MKEITLRKYELGLRYLLVLISLEGVLSVLIHQNPAKLVSSILAVGLLFAPALFCRLTRIKLPAVFQMAILLYIFGSTYLGEVQDFFYRFSFWDDILHSFSALLMGYPGFALIYYLNKDKDIDNKINPSLIALFVFCFVLMISVLWEIFEYGVDSEWGGNMQKARNLVNAIGIADPRLGILDTMRDLVCNSIGAMIGAAIGYFYIKKQNRDKGVFWRMKDSFISENPRLFNETD